MRGRAGLDQCPGTRVPAIPAAGRDGLRFPSGFTAVIALEPHGDGTKYTVLVMHGDEDSRGTREAMGFNDGWGKAVDRLVGIARTM